MRIANLRIGKACYKKCCALLAMAPDLLQSHIADESNKENAEKHQWLEEHIEQIEEARNILSPPSKQLRKAAAWYGNIYFIQMQPQCRLDSKSN